MAEALLTNRAVRVRVAYGPFPVGHIIPDMPGGQRREMIRRNLVEPITQAELKKLNEPVRRRNAEAARAEAAAERERALRAEPWLAGSTLL